MLLLIIHGHLHSYPLDVGVFLHVGFDLAGAPHGAGVEHLHRLVTGQPAGEAAGLRPAQRRQLAI